MGSKNCQKSSDINYGWSHCIGPLASTITITIYLLQASRRSLDGQQRLVWNFPLDITFRSTSPFGWPQFQVSVYGLDSLGNDVVRGYGAIHIPLTSTVHVPYVTLKIPVFVPESASIMQRIAGWIMGRRPEFVDPRVVTSGIIY